MNFKTLTCDIQEGVAIVTLNRPEALNALNEAMMKELYETFSIHCAKEEVRSVYLTGAGRAFCAGGDVKAFGQYLATPEQPFAQIADTLHLAISAMRRLPKPIVAAVNGPAAGAGFSLALASDVILANPEANFSLAYAKIGLSPDGSSTFFLPRLIGPQRTLYYFLTGKKIDAETALKLGIVQEVYPTVEFPQKSIALAKQLALGPTVAYAQAKKLIHQSFYTSLETQLGDESHGIGQTARSQDFFEGVSAFIEKRPATFNGK